MTLSHHKSESPELVVWPHTVEQIQELARICSSNRIPLIPYGTGTGLEGGISAIKGGICVNLQNLNQILEYNPQDFDVKIQPGITRKYLNNFTKDDGLWFPIDPGQIVTRAHVI